MITIAPLTLGPSAVGASFSATISASGGTGPYSFVLTAGALPSGLSLNSSTGVLSGTTSAAGTSVFTVTATDSLSASGARDYSFEVGSVGVGPSAVGPATAGDPFSVAFTASGGTAPYTFAVTSGALPAGLTLDSSGNLMGTPSAAGSSSFSVTATDSAGASGTSTYVLDVVSITISPGALGIIPKDSPYSVTFGANNGIAPYIFAVAAGSLPPGLTLDPASGTLSGTPTTVGVSAFTISVTDKFGAIGSQAYNATVKPPVYWYICSRSEDVPAIPRVAANQAEHNRQVANAIERLTKSPYQAGHLIARPVVVSIPGHLLCDGTEISRTAYPQLFAEIGTTWGEGDGSTTFNLPNMVGSPLTVPLVAPAETITPSSVSSPTTPVTAPSTPAQAGGTTGGGVDSGGTPSKEPLEARVGGSELP